MKRSKLKNKANRTKLQDDIAKYKKQRNLIVKHNRVSKLRYFDKITNNSNEVIKKETLLISNDEIAKTFNKHFTETVETLNTFEWPSNNTDILNDPAIKISELSKYHEIKE